MSCTPHLVVRIEVGRHRARFGDLEVESIEWCPQCGAVRLDADGDWILPGSDAAMDVEGIDAGCALCGAAPGRPCDRRYDGDDANGDPEETHERTARRAPPIDLEARR